jgi:hypothetical protein
MADTQSYSIVSASCEPGYRPRRLLAVVELECGEQRFSTDVIRLSACEDLQETLRR